MGKESPKENEDYFYPNFYRQRLASAVDDLRAKLFLVDSKTEFREFGSIESAQGDRRDGNQILDQTRPRRFIAFLY